MLWHEPGRSELAGDYRGREAVYEYFGKLVEVTEGRFHMDLQAVFADDEHGVALAVLHGQPGRPERHGQGTHIFHLRDGKVVEFRNASTGPYACDELLVLSDS